jgi:hypothetical protein
MVVGVAVVLLVLAVPAIAATHNGYRADYTTSNACQPCHNGQFPSIPGVYDEWMDTKHAVAGADDQALRLPYGSVCQGCHTSNFDPAKVVPTPTATNAAGVVSWAAGNGIPTQPQTEGNAASSENFVGCSSCHYGMQIDGNFGSDPSNTAHKAPLGLLASAEICGQCHSRYSYTTQTFAVQAVPYLTVTTPTPGTPITPNPTPTTLIQPQMALGGYPMLGTPGAAGWNPAPPLTDYLNIQSPGWAPTPNPAATSAGLAKLQTYWKDAKGDMMWQQTGHDGSAAQYPDWAIEGHADALTGLTGQSFWAFLDEATKKECLECHSADFRILKEAGKNPSSTDAQYGITCVGCHTPHENTTEGGAWDEEWTPQLRTGSAQTLCIECHNGELPVGGTASPGAEIHHPMKEMMAGYGAIGVTEIPSPHEGECVKCHMPPTSVSRGSVQLGGNHTFNIIEPEVALEASPIPVITTSAVATVLPSGSATPVATTTNTVTYDSMPYSACSTCHSNNNGVRATPQPYETTTATPSPASSPIRVTVTIKQSANQSAWGNYSGGDRGLWLQGKIEQRQAWTKAKIATIQSELTAAAVKLGYADTAAAHEALVAIPEAQWTASQRLFLSAFTNVQFVQSEGSYGIHNWLYTVAIVNKAHEQVLTVVAPDPRKWIVSLRVSKTQINKGQKIFFRGVVQTGWGFAGKGKVTLQRRMAGKSWRNWKTQTLKTNGTYDIQQRLNFTGKWYFRVSMPGDGGLNLAAVSPNRVIRIN